MTISTDESGNLSIPDKTLFRDPPPKEDCPICMLPMPYNSGACGVRTTYMPCCGKVLCDGCVVAASEEMKKGNTKKWCPFCRVPLPSSKKVYFERYNKP